MASYLRQMGITERVLFWDINDPEYVVTYDPFSEAGHSPSYLAGSMATALLGTLGEGKHKDASDFAQLKPNTEDGFEALLRAKLPFVLSQRFFHPQEIVALADLSGVLEVVAFHGDYDALIPFDLSPRATRMVVVLKRRG